MISSHLLLSMECCIDVSSALGSACARQCPLRIDYLCRTLFLCVFRSKPKACESLEKIKNGNMAFVFFLCFSESGEERHGRREEESLVRLDTPGKRNILLLWKSSICFSWCFALDFAYEPAFCTLAAFTITLKIIATSNLRTVAARRSEGGFT